MNSVESDNAIGGEDDLMCDSHGKTCDTLIMHATTRKGEAEKYEFYAYIYFSA
jgi:hypothetical protein